MIAPDTPSGTLVVATHGVGNIKLGALYTIAGYYASPIMGGVKFVRLEETKIYSYPCGLFRPLHPAEHENFYIPARAK